MSTEPSILDQIDAIRELDAENRRLEAVPPPPCWMCEQGRPCWYHRRPQWREVPDET